MYLDAIQIMNFYIDRGIQKLRRTIIDINFSNTAHLYTNMTMKLLIHFLLILKYHDH